MGKRIDRVTFDEADFARFRERLGQCLAALGELLDRPGFGVGPTTIGAELELFLVDEAGRPIRRNQEVRNAAADPRITLEVDKFNLELNASPILLGGRPFTALGRELEQLLGRVAGAAARYGGRSALIGILPTLREADLRADAISAAPRYYALDAGLRRLRAGDSFRIRIAGADSLQATSDAVAFEGANTSFQVHLRVNPGDFTRTYNTVQLAIAPVLAVAGNSPTFLGRRLWDETRVALLKQSIDDRDGRVPRRTPARVAFGTGWLRNGPQELFAESVRMYQPLLPVLDPGPGPLDSDHGLQVPPLPELRLHLGTVWSWNRAVYDPTEGGHLRIEMRALPAGPTVIDMLANAAFLLGLSLSLANEDPSWSYVLSFERAEHNFIEAAKHGLAAELSWPFVKPGKVSTMTASRLVTQLLSRARDGLTHAGVTNAEADHLLTIVESRVATGQTGAAWQRKMLADADQRLGREAAVAAMFQRYLQCAATGDPVHTWSTMPSL
jgi:gamma-glutamyl:cysteine ligase YbdK (ATP-grasp superfamily)